MSNEIHVDYSSGNTLYAVIRNQDGQVWHVAGETFENWGTGGHTADDYDIALADSDGSHYIGDFDTHISGGSYSIQIFRQAGTYPASTDTLVSSRPILWTGSGELTATKILANRAVMNKVDGMIDYYDDDGQTVLLTLTPCDTVGFLSRLPG